MSRIPDPGPGPDFIGIGPEKTGTTWMDRQLRAHDQVQVPPIKELRYFWEQYRFPDESFRDRMDSESSWHRNQYRSYLHKRLNAFGSSPFRTLTKERKRLLWDIRYLFYRHDDEWYLSCFDGKSDRVSGEISPQYFFLPLEQVAAIHNLLPNSKIIVSLRQPHDWVWSFAKMNMRTGFIQEKYGSLEAYIETKIEKNSFSGKLKQWKSYYPDDQLLVLIYDNLLLDPWEYYSEICQFLAIKPDESRREMLEAIVNEGSKEQIPDNIAAMIEDGWRDDILELSSLVPNMPSNWIR